MKSSCYPDSIGSHLSCLLLEFCILGKTSIREGKKTKQKTLQLWDQTTYSSGLKQFLQLPFNCLKRLIFNLLLSLVLVAEEAAISTYQPIPMVGITVFRSGLLSSGQHPLLQSTTLLSSSQLLLIIQAVNYSFSRDKLPSRWTAQDGELQLLQVSNNCASQNAYFQKYTNFCHRVVK